MRYIKSDIVFIEVPNETSLCFSITGCEKRCKGCHSPELWSEKESDLILNEENYLKILNEYKNLITAVCFLGGEWHKEELINFLKIAKKYKLKTALYSSEEEISEDIKKYLTYLKTGRFIEKLGGLYSKNTNQKFINLETGEDLTKSFFKN